MKKRMKWSKTEIIILCLLGVIAITAVIVLVSIMLEYSGGKSTYNALQEYVFLPDEPKTLPQARTSGDGNSTAQQSGQPTESASVAAADVPGVVYYGQCPQVNFDALKTQNSDIKGWIYGPGTTINYPVVQGEDNAYYLTHMFDGRENKCGSIFMDSLNAADLSNTNTIIHGHHMKNGSMFASLPRYASQSYYNAHPVLWLATPEKSYKVEIFTGFVTDTASDVWQIEFATKEDYRNWLDKMIDNGAFKSDIKPAEDDRIITLATCSYEFDDARFVVMGVLRDTE